MMKPVFFKKYATIMFYVIAVFAPLHAEAASFCIAPRAPSLFVTKPVKPLCASQRNCSQWQVDSYKSELERYFNELQQYQIDLEKYYKKANEYIECMADLD